MHIKLVQMWRLSDNSYVGRWRGRGPNWSLGLLHGINEDLLFPQALLHLNTDQLPWLCEVSSVATPWTDDSTMCTSQEHPRLGYLHHNACSDDLYCFFVVVFQTWYIRFVDCSGLNANWPGCSRYCPIMSVNCPECRSRFAQSLLSSPAMFNKTFGSCDFCIIIIIMCRIYCHIWVK